MLLSFYETHKDDGDRGLKSGRGDAVADAAADEAETAVAMVLPASRPMASQLLAVMMLQRQATRRNFAAPIKAAPATKLTTHLRASIMLNLLLIANASARRPPALPPFSLPSPAINLAMAPLPFLIVRADSGFSWHIRQPLLQSLMCARRPLSTCARSTQEDPDWNKG